MADKCKIDLLKDSLGVYSFKKTGNCQQFEVTRAKNTIAFANLSNNIGGSTFEAWEQDNIPDYDRSTVHQVIFPKKMQVQTEFGDFGPQVVVRDPDTRVMYSAIVDREEQVEGEERRTFNQIAIIGKCLDPSIHSSYVSKEKGTGKIITDGKSTTTATTDTIQYVEIHELHHPGFEKGEKSPATDQFIFINEKKRDRDPKRKPRDVIFKEWG